MEPASWKVHTRFELVIFCRNVAIYFDCPTQETLFTGLASLLEPTGYLLSGHSENLHGLPHVLRALGNTVHVQVTPSSGAPLHAAARAGHSGRQSGAPKAGR